MLVGSLPHTLHFRLRTWAHARHLEHTPPIHVYPQCCHALQLLGWHIQVLASVSGDQHHVMGWHKADGIMCACLQAILTSIQERCLMRWRMSKGSSLWKSLRHQSLL